MADGSHIEWTDATWNPLTGCTKVSAGCDNCYAEGVVNRWHAAGKPAFPTRFDTVSLRHTGLLYLPLRWRDPKRVFVNSLSDLFHANVPDEFIARVFAIMALAPRHTFQLLTKRHARMRSLLSDDGFRSEVADEIVDLTVVDNVPEPEYLTSFEADWWPLPHVWLGVSVEDQRWADIRIPALLDTPAAVRWISAEPLLGPLDLSQWLSPPGACVACGGSGSMPVPGGGAQCPTCSYDRRLCDPSLLDWVVVGGESGPGARPMHPAWARSVRDDCAGAGVPFLFKQWGSWTLGASVRPGERRAIVWPHGPYTFVAPTERVRQFSIFGAALMRRQSKQAAGRELDGRMHDGYPQARLVVGT